MKEPFISNNMSTWASATTGAYSYSNMAATWGSAATDGVSGMVLFRTTILTGAVIRGIVAAIQTAATSTNDIVFTCFVYPTPGSSTNARTVGTLTIPANADAAGDVWQRFSGLANTNVNPGEEVVVVLTTKGSAATTRNGFVSVLLEPVFVGKIAEAKIDQAKPYGSNAAGTINTVVA
jgi:hypothetical protein